MCDLRYIILYFIIYKMKDKKNQLRLNKYQYSIFNNLMNFNKYLNKIIVKIVKRK